MSAEYENPTIVSHHYPNYQTNIKPLIKFSQIDESHRNNVF